MLAGVSDHAPDCFIADALGQTLRAETGHTVLVIHFAPVGARLQAEDWQRLDLSAGEDQPLGPFLETTESGVAVLHATVPPAPEGPFLVRLLRLATRTFQNVLVHAGSTVPSTVVVQSLQLSDRAFLLMQPRGEDFYLRDLLLRDIRRDAPECRVQLRTIICRERGEEQSNQLLKQMGPEIHGFIHGCPAAASSGGVRRCPDRDFNAGLRRLAREIAHRRVGLALSSGGARGLAHIGVIQVLEENGIEVDVVAGCSMGSYIGAVWAYGYDGVAMERLARQIENRWGLFHLIDPFILPRQGFLRGEKVKARLKESIGDVHFSELVRPLRIVATHLASLDRVVFSAGEVARAVHASSAIPGACIPIDLDGELYIDGGIADPLPVDVLEEMGIERIIAINTIPTPAYLRARIELEKERDARRGRKTNQVKAFINRYLNYFAPGNVLDTILRSFNGAQMQVAEHSCQFADVVLRPLSFDGRWHDFRRPGKYIAIGRRETEQHLDEVKALVNRKEPTYDSQPAQFSVATAL